MKTATSEFISAISDGCPYHTVKFYLLGAEINVIVKSFNYYGILSSTDGISIGNTCSSYCEFELYNNNYNLENNEVQIKVGVEVNGIIEYISLGYFTIKNLVKENNIIKYTAFDRMIKLEDKYSPSSVSNLTTVSIINDMCRQLGFEFENTLDAISVTKSIVGYTYREMFGFISALHGANCIFNDSGKLEFVWFTQPSSDLATIDESVMYENGLELTSNSSFKVKYLKCATGETIENTTTDENGEETTETTDVILSVGSGTTGITLSNPLMTQEILTNIYNTYFFNFEYQPCNVKRLGNILLEVGDIVTVNLGTKSYSVPIMTIQHSIDGGVVTNLVSMAETETEQSISYESPTQRYVAQTVSSEVGTQIQELSANMVTTDYIASNYAKINLANIEKGCITNAMIRNATISSAKIVDLDANKINAGTLSCDRLLFNGSDKSIVYYLNNMGNLVSEEVNTINGDTLTDRTITADKIVANSITANEINVFDLFAQNITATGTITGLTVSAGEIYGSYINGGSLFIGNSNGTYASISSSGKLTCTGAKISGKLDLDNGITFNSSSADIGIISYSSEGFIFGSNVDVPMIFSSTVGGNIEFRTKYTTLLEIKAEIVRCYETLECDSISIGKTSYLNTALYLGSNTDSSGTRYYINSNGTGRFNTLYEDGTALSSKYADKSHTSHSSLYSDTNVRIGNNGVTSTEYALATYWKDGSVHNLASRASDGLTSFFGWAGSSSYATICNLRSRTCRYTNASGTTNLSDVRLKDNFTSLDKWSSFFDAIEPCAFKMKTGNSGRFHIGYKAQQIEQALVDNGLTTQDFGGFIKMPYLPDSDNEEVNKVYEEVGIKEGEDEYGLIYTEFTALNTYEIQKLKTKVKEQQNEIEILKQRLENLEQKVGGNSAS